MKRLALSAMLGLAMVATAAAQYGTGSGSSNPSSSSPSSGGSMSGGSSSAQDQSSTSTSASGNTSAGSKDHKDSGKKAKMTGCVSSQGGSYFLVDKKHPSGVQLVSSEDLSSHVGHKVEVKGNWEAASAASSAGPSSASSANPSSSASSTNPSGSASASGTTSEASNPTSAGSGSASSLPQSDVGGGKAIRVSEIKMKSDTCEGANKSNTPSTPK